MNQDRVKEEGEHSIRTVIVMGPDSNHKASLAIDECMNHNLPADQTYAVALVSQLGRKGSKLVVTMLAIVVPE